MSQPAQRAQLDWLLHTFMPGQLLAAGLTAEAAQVDSIRPITSEPRLQAAQNALLAYRESIVALYDPSWEQHFQAVTDRLWANFYNDLPDWLGLYADTTDPAVFAFFKLAMSTAGLVLTKAAAEGA